MEEGKEVSRKHRKELFGMTAAMEPHKSPSTKGCCLRLSREGIFGAPRNLERRGGRREAKGDMRDNIYMDFWDAGRAGGESGRVSKLGSEMMQVGWTVQNQMTPLRVDRSGNRRSEGRAEDEEDRTVREDAHGQTHRGAGHEPRRQPVPVPQRRPGWRAADSRVTRVLWRVGLVGGDGEGGDLAASGDLAGGGVGGGAEDVGPGVGGQGAENGELLDGADKGALGGKLGGGLGLGLGELEGDVGLGLRSHVPRI